MLYRHHLLCTLPSCTRGRSELIWKRKSSFKSFPARWKRCRSPDFNLEAEQSPSGRRERHQLVGSRCHRLPSCAGQGASAGSGCSCSGTGAQGSAFLQLDSALATTDRGGRVEKQPLPEPAGLGSRPTAQLWLVAASATASKTLARRKARWWEMLAPVARKGSGIPCTQGLCWSHQLPVVIYGLAAKHQSELVRNELLRSQRIAEAPRSARRSRTTKNPCGNSWKTGSLLYSCLYFKRCFKAVFQRLHSIPEYATAFQRGF